MTNGKDLFEENIMIFLKCIIAGLDMGNINWYRNMLTVGKNPPCRFEIIEWNEENFILITKRIFKRFDL